MHETFDQLAATRHRRSGDASKCRPREALHSALERMAGDNVGHVIVLAGVREADGSVRYWMHEAGSFNYFERVGLLDECKAWVQHGS